MTSELNPEQKAAEYLENGLQFINQGEFKKAMRCFSRSSDLCATAEGYTFRGWAYSYMGEIDKAIADCHKAIEVDPTFGNPYNDIGVYLLKQKQYEEAIPWLKKAIKAERYEPRHYPHFNLGQIYEMLDRIPEAVDEYEKAVEAEPMFMPARESLGRLRKGL